MNSLLEQIFIILEAFGNVVTVGVPNIDNLYGYDAYDSDDSSEDSDSSEEPDDDCVADIHNKRLKQYNKVHKEATDLFEQKNQDYGDSFADYGTAGVLMRMTDKLNRYQSITRNGVTLVDDEKLRDTLIDLHNYSAMAVMLLDE